MREGGGKQNLLRKKNEIGLHLETARRLLRYGAFAVEKDAQQISHAKVYGKVRKFPFCA